MFCFLFLMLFVQDPIADEKIDPEIPVAYTVSTIPPDVIKDVEFTRIQEEWLYETKLVHGYNVVLDKEEARSIRQLGCPTWECREFASEMLQKRGYSAIRGLYWGTKSTDYEIVLRSKRLLNGLYKCQHCSGTGSCPVNSGAPNCETEQCDWKGRCRACTGSGDYRYYLCRKPGDWENLYKKERDLFSDEEISYDLPFFEDDDQ